MSQTSFLLEGQINIDNVKKYVNSSDNPNTPDINGIPPLIAATAISGPQGSYLVKKLLSNGADPNSQDNLGNTALMKAFGSRDKSTDLVINLLRAGANPNIQNQLGQTALMLMTGGIVNGFKYYESKKIATALKKVGITPNISDSEGNTTLMYLQNDHEKHFVKILLEVGADISLKNKYGKSAIDCVSPRYGQEIHNMLMNSESYTKPTPSMTIGSAITNAVRTLEGFFK